MRIVETKNESRADYVIMSLFRDMGYGQDALAHTAEMKAIADKFNAAMGFALSEGEVFNYLVQRRKHRDNWGKAHVENRRPLVILDWKRRGIVFGFYCEADYLGDELAYSKEFYTLSRHVNNVECEGGESSLNAIWRCLSGMRKKKMERVNFGAGGLYGKVMYTYFYSMRNFDTGTIEGWKIGRSECPRARRNQHQTSQDRDVCDELIIAEDLEKEFHEKWREHRYRMTGPGKELFRPAPEIAEWIEANRHLHCCHR